MAKSFLAENGIEFEDLNVALDKEARREMLGKSGQLGVPIIDVDGEIIVGFNQARLKEKLGIQG